MTLPNFIIVGAPKCATTSLYYYLKQHPDVFMSQLKEPNFFCSEWKQEHRKVYNNQSAVIDSIEEYEGLFKDHMGEKVIGEASIHYLANPSTPKRIKELIPGVKLLAALRQPADRAYSHYKMERGNYFTDTANTFEKALALEEERIHGNCHPTFRYRTTGFYAQSLSRYYEVFDPKQIKVVIYDDINRDQPRIIREIFEFLEVDPAFIPDTSQKYMSTKVNRMRGLVKLAHNLGISQVVKRWLTKNVVAPETLDKAIKVKAGINPETRRELTLGYMEDIKQLEKMLGRNLSCWYDFV